MPYLRPKSFFMKKTLLLLSAILLFTTSCSDVFEKQLKTYENAIEDLDDADDFQELMTEVLNTGKEIAVIKAKSTDEDIEELKEDYAEEYDVMADSVKTVCERYYSRADELFNEYVFNFVERRTILYQMAADRYCVAESIEELNSIKEIIKRYSALAFVESQRACDPPAQIRKNYEATKELAENCFEVAKKRILDKDKENEE